MLKGKRLRVIWGSVLLFIGLISLKNILTFPIEVYVVVEILLNQENFNYGYITGRFFASFLFFVIGVFSLCGAYHIFRVGRIGAKTTRPKDEVGR